ncbi:MAG: hypothetical protein R2715_22065 [Ilumatobacteraceae bacterium]
MGDDAGRVIPGLRAYGRQLLGRTAIIGSAADTVTVAVEAAISAIQIADGAVEHVRSRFELREHGRQADPVEDLDERIRVELLDVDHRSVSHSPRATSNAAATGGTPAV